MNPITNNIERSRFETEVDGLPGFVEYRLFDGGIIYSHTEVDPGLGGKGVGSLLAKYVLDYARDQGLKVIVTCPFIKVYIKRHPEYAPLTNLA